MKGFVLPEQAHIVNILPPVDINGSAVNSDVFALTIYKHADIIITAGVTGAASTVTVEECSDFTPSASTAISFSYYSETTDAGDTLSTRTAATASGFSTSTNNNIMYVISVDADQLTDTYENLRICFSNPGVSTIVSAVAVLSGARYQEETTRTAIA